MKRLTSIALLLLAGCSQTHVKVPDEITVRHHVYHHRSEGDDLPSGAHIVLPAAKPEDFGTVIPQRVKPDAKTSEK